MHQSMVVVTEQHEVLQACVATVAPVDHVMACQSTNVGSAESFGSRNLAHYCIRLPLYGSPTELEPIRDRQTPKGSKYPRRA
jgi:hypothetical protein